jgi:acyl-coenzyme A synthetase/AMP-(fatty) acid ligase
MNNSLSQWTVGRIDDVINVARYRLGTKELESVALTVNEVAEAAAVRSSTTTAAEVGGRARQRAPFS